MSDVIIRQGKVLDHTEILTLGIKWFEEASIKGMPGFCSYSGVWLADLITNHLVFVGEYEGKIIGVLALRIGHMPWNLNEKVLVNDLFMTEKEKRKTGVATMLLEVAKQFAQEQKMSLIMGHMTGTDAELKDRYFKIEGFKYSGANFIYRG